jgi:hypothetical protein
MRKAHGLWPWQWGAAEEPCFEHITAINAMDAFYNEAEAYRKEDTKVEEPKEIG